MMKAFVVALLLVEGGHAGNLRGEEESDGYDVIVVGGGLTGSVVAAKLSEKLPHKRVLMLEAGKASQQVLGGTEVPGHRANGRWYSWPGTWNGLTRYDVPGNYGVLNCWHSGCDEQSWPKLQAYQCKILGGCGVMSGALGQIPRPGSFESWPEGWRHDNLKHYLYAAREMFHYTQIPSSDGVHHLNGTGVDIVRDAMAGAGLVDGDPMDARNGIMGYPYVSAKNGVRVSSTSELVPDALQRTNFGMRLEVHVTKILHDDHGNATAVMLEDGEVINLNADGRVVLTAGVWNTAQLLLESGVSNEQVGKGISDHTHHVASFHLRDRTGQQASSVSYSPPSLESINQYLGESFDAVAGSGPLSQFGPTFVAYIKDPTSPGAEDLDFDVEVWVQPAVTHNTNYGPVTQLVMGLVLMRPTCSTTDVIWDGDKLVRVNDSVHEGCDRDRQTVRYAEDFVTKAMAKVGYQGGFRQGDDMNHWAGSCKLGTCVDPNTLTVYGTRNVAVADASVLPAQVWAHPSLTLQAVALKAADMLAGQLRLASRS